MITDTPFSVLFVDDEERVLSGLRRQLRPHRTRWELRFASSGPDALAQMEARCADVVVSDMRMPRMSGTELMNAVRQRWPGTVRIILSGQTDRTEIVNAIGAVHQFLQKPCPALDLVRAIERCHELASILQRTELRTTASVISSLPVVPEIYSELLDALDDARSDAHRISGVVERDVGLATKVLQLVNSAFFALPRRIDRLQEAVSLLGVAQLRAVALSGLAFDALDDQESCGPAIRSLWSSSFEIGRLAERFAVACDADPAKIAQARLAGMLSLVGRAVLIRMNRERYEVVRARSQTECLPLHEVETAELGAAHHLVGGYALGMWAFADDVVNAVTFQATPELCETTERKHPLTFVHLARCFQKPGPYVDRLAPSRHVRELLGVTEVQLRELRAKGEAA